VSDCTNYNEAISYNAPINYNGVCVSPVTTVVSGGRWNYQKPRDMSDDDFAIVLMTLELMDD
jgi:hypothetical protein